MILATMIDTSYSLSFSLKMKDSKNISDVELTTTQIDVDDDKHHIFACKYFLKKYLFKFSFKFKKATSIIWFRKLK